MRVKLSHPIKITLKSHFCRKTLYFFHYVGNVDMDVITFPEILYTTSGLSILLLGDISLPDAIVGNPNRKKMHIFGFVGIFEYIC